jgi:hypothetical protein
LVQKKDLFIGSEEGFIWLVQKKALYKINLQGVDQSYYSVFLLVRKKD